MFTLERPSIGILEKGIVIAEGSRCCKKHLIGNMLDKAVLDDIEPNAADLKTNRSGIVKIIESVRNVAKTTNSKRLDFDHDKSMTDENYMVLTGLDRAQFDDLLTFVQESKPAVRKTDLNELPSDCYWLS